MALSQEALKALALELAAAMPLAPARANRISEGRPMNEFLREELADIMRESMPAPRLELTPTGEVLSHEAMEVARFYHRATRRQQAALDAMVRAMDPQL